MNIFDKRPLALILCISLAGFVTFSCEEVWLRVLALLAIPLLILLSALLKGKRKLLIVATVTLVISIFCSYLYFDFWFYPQNIFKGEVQASGQIVQLEQTKNGYKMYIETDNIDNAPASRYTLISYVSKEEAAPLKAGDIISFSATLSGFEGGDFDLADYYRSLGINAMVEITGDITVTSHRENLTTSFAYIRENLRRRAIMQSDAHTGNLVAALLLGERNMLSGQVLRDFKYIGIMHTLALSGMHLAILTLAISKLLMLIGVGKRTRDILSILFTAFYVAFTGFSASVLRAGLMLIISSLLKLLSRTSDSLTSLVLAVFIICAATPFSIFDIGLWLSAFATLGLIVLGEYIATDKEKEPVKLKATARFLKILILSTIFAISATLIFSAFSFGGVSMVSPISTMIFSPLIELIMYTGTFMLIFGNILPVGDLLSPICKFTEWLAGALASLKGVYASTEFTLSSIMIVLLFVLLVIFMLFNIKHRARFATLITVWFFLTLGTAFVQNYSLTLKDDIAFESSKESSYFIIKSEGEVALISSGAYSFEQYNVTGSLRESYVFRIDKLCITHYSFVLPDYLNEILERCDVKDIILPTPRSEEEKALLKLLENTLTDYRVKISTVGKDTKVTVGDVNITQTYFSEFGENMRAAFKIENGTTKIAYLSSGMLEKDTYAIANDLLLGASIAIFGSTGEQYKEGVYMKTPYPLLDRLIISSENLYITQSVKSYYLNSGCDIVMHPDKISLTE